MLGNEAQRVNKLEQDVYRILSRKHGLKINSEANRLLVEFLISGGGVQSAENVQEHVDFIAKEWIQSQQEGNGKAKAIDKEGLTLTLQNAMRKRLINQNVQESANENSDIPLKDISQFLTVLDTFTLPAYDFYADTKTFRINTIGKSLIAPAPSIPLSFRARYNVLKQRLLRNPAFQKPKFTSSKDDYYKITPIFKLRGAPVGEYLLFGMLTQMSEGKLHLEDLDSAIEIILPEESKLNQGPGFFTRNCFVLVEGQFTVDGTFIVEVLSMPLMEERKDSMIALSGHIDLFGKIGDVAEAELMQNIELNAVDVSFVILSDVWLDQPKVFEKLRVLFEGYSQTVIPLAFIFIGNFQSAPFQSTGAGAKGYKESFDQLATLISEFPQIAQLCHFIFVPGSNDPWAGSVLPRPPVPSTYTSRLSAKVKNAHFTANPCRIKYCTKEIVIIREDLMNVLRRNVVVPVAKGSAPMEHHLVRTILEQSCLVPIQAEIKPIYWNHYSALMVYPQPHLLILADKCEAYEHDYMGCKAINPGQFLNSDFQFMVYQPATNECEYSKIE